MLQWISKFEKPLRFTFLLQFPWHLVALYTPTRYTQKKQKKTILLFDNFIVKFTKTMNKVTWCWKKRLNITITSTTDSIQKNHTNLICMEYKTRVKQSTKPSYKKKIGDERSITGFSIWISYVLCVWAIVEICLCS